MAEDQIFKLISDGSIITILASLLVWFIKAYRDEVRDHKETLKEIAGVRQKMQEVQEVVRATRLPTQTGI